MKVKIRQIITVQALLQERRASRLLKKQEALLRPFRQKAIQSLLKSMKAGEFNLMIVAKLLRTTQRIKMEQAFYWITDLQLQERLWLGEQNMI